MDLPSDTDLGKAELPNESGPDASMLGNRGLGETAPVVASRIGHDRNGWMHPLWVGMNNWLQYGVLPARYCPYRATPGAVVVIDCRYVHLNAHSYV